MTKGLKIYGCSGFGVGAAATNGYNYWMDNTSTITNTKITNSLLVEVNVLNAAIQYGNLDREELLTHLNLIDLYVVILQSLKDYSDNLSRCGRCIAQLIKDSAFDYSSLQNEERDEHLDKVYANLTTMMAEGADYEIDNEFTNWFNDYVIDNNIYALTPAQRDHLLSVRGVAGGEDIQELMIREGCYHLYEFTEKEDLQYLSKAVLEKRTNQKRLREVIHFQLDDLFADKTAVDKLIEAGCYTYYQQNPRNVMHTLVTGEKQANGVGVILWTAASIVKLVAALASFLIVVITLIFQFCSTKNAAKYEVPDYTEGAMPSEDDWEEILQYQSEKKNKSLITYGLLALAAVLLFKK